jgi:hypothetical protein
MHRLRAATLALLLAVCATSTRAWEPMVQHSGTNNPVDEGWSKLPDSPSVPAQGLVDGGTPVWWISGNGSGGALRYHFSSLWTDPYAKALYNGWRVTARLRIPDASDPLDNSAFLSAGAVLPDGSAHTYLLLFGSDAATNLQVYPYGADDIHTSTPGYHDVVVRYTAARADVSVWVDGVLIATNVPPATSGPGAWLTFGSIDEYAGETYWNSVRFEVDDSPVVTNVTAVNNGYRVSWLAMTSHLSSVQFSSSPSPAADWTTLSGCSGLTWRSDLCCTNHETSTQRYFRVLQYQP